MTGRIVLVLSERSERSSSSDSNGGRIEDEDDEEDEGCPARGKRIEKMPNTASHGTARKLAARERQRSLKE